MSELSPNRQVAEDLLNAVNESAGTARALVVTLQVLAIYSFIVVSGTTDEQLLRNSTVAVPTLSNATLPAQAFYAVIPWVFVFLHLDLLIHLKLLSDKLKRFNEAVQSLADDTAERDLRLRIAGFPYSTWLGSDPRTGALAHWLQGVVVWVTLVGIPLLLLVYAQLGFLAFHDQWITWGHRLALLVDAGLLLYFWPRLVRGRYRRAADMVEARSPAVWQEVAGRAWSGVRYFLGAARARMGATAARLPASLRAIGEQARTLGVRAAPHMNAALRAAWVLPVTLYAGPLLLFAFFVATIPDEGMDMVARRLMGEVQGENRTDEQRAEWNTCIRRLSSLSLFEVSPPAGLRATCVAVAVFHRSDASFRRHLTVRDRVLATDEVRPEVVVKVRRTLRELREVSDAGMQAGGKKAGPLREFEDAVFEVRGLNLSRRDLRYADLRGTSLPNVILDDARLEHADLGGIDLRNAKLVGATLTGATLREATLTGATLREATLTAAKLGGATLTGANLRGAALTGANLQKATLTGANLAEAMLTGAELSGATLTGANLLGATLTGADLVGATLTGANLEGATLTGADLEGATLTGANLVEAKLTGAGLFRATLTGANLSGASLIGSNFKNARQSFLILLPPPSQGTVTTKDIESFESDLVSLTQDTKARIRNKSSMQAGRETEDFRPIDCVGSIQFCGADEAIHARNASRRAELLKGVACPGDGKPDRDIAFAIVHRLSSDTILGPPLLELKFRTRVALANAAAKELRELATGPCGAELSEAIPKEFRLTRRPAAPQRPSEAAPPKGALPPRVD